MKELVALLKERNLTIGCCESLTAGLFASKIAEVSGASAVLKGALVTYQNEIKIKVAHVEKEIIDTYGVISEECAIAMAKHALELLSCDLCVSFTGNAGPSAMEGKPAGLVYCAIAGPMGLQTYRFLLKLERNQLREELVQQMCENVIRYIQSME